MNLEHLASQLVAIGLDVAIKATVLLVLTCAVISLYRRSSAAIRHSIWLVAMLGLLALPLATWALPAWRLPILPAGYAGTTVEALKAESRASVASAQSFTLFNSCMPN